MTETFTPSATRSDVVVFDFDGTLVSRDSFLDFCFAYCRARPARWLLIVPLLPVALLLLLTSRWPCCCS
jgi:hypothetical protein